jgi:hypothetical protein
MEKITNYECLKLFLMDQNELNLILLETGRDEISSAESKRKVKSEMVDILKNDLTGTLLLPFNKPDHR